MIVAKINDHVAAALDRLIQQYKGRPFIAGLITALVEQIQDLEDAIYPLDKYRQLKFAYGAQLDGLGEIVGLKRNGLSDDEYLLLLLGTIAENFSDTTAVTMLYVVQTCFNASAVFKKDPNSCVNKTDIPGAWLAFGVQNPLVPENLYPIVIQIIQNAMGAGEALVYVAKYPAGDGKTFSTQGRQAWCGGCSSVARPNSGGLMSGLIYNNTTQ